MSDLLLNDDLLAKYLDGVADESDLASLEERLLASPETADALAALVRFETMLQIRLTADRGPRAAEPAMVQRASALQPPIANGSLPVTFDTVAGYSASAYFSGWPVAYLIAAVIFGVGLTIGALVHVSHPSQLVAPSSPQPSPLSPLPSVVAQITGMIDCEWEGTEGRGQGEGAANQKSEIRNQKSVLHLGDRLALRSGLLEVTYDTGAKVILQGPVTYEVESPTGGYLSIGRLTARLEQKSEIRGQRSEAENHPSENINHKFSIRTPTAIVTDLGTEFGVEVDSQGFTQSHVFRGVVSVQVVATDGKTQGDSKLVQANQSARIDRNGGKRTIVVVPSAKTVAFVREIPRQIVKTLDLVDVVAGGDGYSGQRNRGIDSATGQAQTHDVTPQQNPIIGDGQYHRVEGMPFVDGVFVPKSAAGPVQLDSAGHVFAGFAPTDNNTCGYVWAFKSDTINAACELDGVNYTMHGHAMLEMHANKGITFDLRAIRLANADCKLVRFQTVTGNTERVSEKGYPVWADVWVFVDGQVKFRRREINRYNGAMQIVIPINDQDRFLTLVATDGGNGYGLDHIVFGDPRLELIPANTSTDPTPPPEAAEH